jgi:hypothetical protein
MNFDDYPPQADPNQTDGVDDTVTQCSQTSRSRIFWALLGLSWVLTSIAIYGTWTDRLSPLWNWPLWLAGAVLLYASTRYAEKR